VLCPGERKTKKTAAKDEGAEMPLAAGKLTSAHQEHGKQQGLRKARKKETGKKGDCFRRLPESAHGARVR